MLPFEEEDQEPVAVVRTLSDFALALTLIVLMLIGTRSAADTQARGQSRAASLQSEGTTPDLDVAMGADGKFLPASENSPGLGVSASEMAHAWRASHPGQAAIVVLRFPPKTLATDLHQALLAVQTALATNLVRIDTVPQ